MQENRNKLVTKQTNYKSIVWYYFVR